MHSRPMLVWAVRLLMAGLLTCAAWLAVAQAVAEWYFHRETLEGFRAAVRWDPRNPEYHAALARALELSLEGDAREILAELKIATQLGPRRAGYWAQLGAAYELLGDAGRAESAYQTAYRLFPNSPDINWKLGNYFVRSGRLIEAMRAFRTALTGDSALQRPAFYVAWRATEDNDLILNELVPPEPERLLAYLAYLAETDRMDAARETWKRLMRLNAAFEPRATFGYLDALIRARRLDELESAWNALAERFPLQFPRDAGAKQLVVNSGFEFPISNGGLDWRIGAVEGVTARMDRQFFYDGTHALRLDFDGSTNVAYAQLLQYVLVRPQTYYRFTGYIRSRGITTDSGPRFELLDAQDPARLSVETEAALGTAGWSPFSVQFRTGPETKLLVLRLARRPSRKFDNRLAGTVWIDHVELSALREDGGANRGRPPPPSGESP